MDRNSFMVMLALLCAMPMIVHAMFFKMRTSRLPKWLNWLMPYRYDNRNPYRRYCRACGTEENYYVASYSDGDVPIGWEPVGVMYPCRKSHN